ncbi:hypothetical protein N7488_007492 [Penicillium malachiteum]|nr:hypothetical protein N7488_007492 [Penicillium malachiteum]
MSKSQARKDSTDHQAFETGNENRQNDQQITEDPESGSLAGLLHNEDYPMASRSPTPDQHPADPEVKVTLSHQNQSQ